jgi:hypothetical protein
MQSDQDLKALLAAASKEPWTWNVGRWVEALMSSGKRHVILTAPAGNDTADDDARLAYLAPTLAREVLDRRSAGQELAEVAQETERQLQQLVEDAVVTKRQVTGDEHAQGYCDGLRAALGVVRERDRRPLDRWNTLGEEGEDMGWLKEGMERAREERESWPTWMRQESHDEQP